MSRRQKSLAIQKMNIKFQELKKYLTDNNCFGFTVQIRKKFIVYTFKRFFNGSKLDLRIKVDSKTKDVISVICDDEIYEDLDKLKEKIAKIYH